MCGRRADTVAKEGENEPLFAVEVFRHLSDTLVVPEYILEIGAIAISLLVELLCLFPTRP